MSLFKEFTKYHYGDSDILPTEDERFYHCAVNSLKGIPVIIEIADKDTYTSETRRNERISKLRYSE